MKYRALFHVHPSVIPYFDKDNKRLKKKIVKYLNFLKRKNIRIIRFTWHSHLFCENENLMGAQVSFSKSNLLPLEIFNIFKKEADKMGILALPCLEIDTTIKVDRLRKVVYIILMHEDAEVVFNTSFLYNSFMSPSEM